jgi:hypothetical protein
VKSRSGLFRDKFSDQGVRTRAGNANLAVAATKVLSRAKAAGIGEVEDSISRRAADPLLKLLTTALDKHFFFPANEIGVAPDLDLTLFLL